MHIKCSDDNQLIRQMVYVFEYSSKIIIFFLFRSKLCMHIKTREYIHNIPENNLEFCKTSRSILKCYLISLASFSAVHLVLAIEYGYLGVVCP